MSKEDMVREYVKGKAHSWCPGVTQIRLGNKAKGYALASTYTGAWIFFASYVCPNAVKYYDNVNKVGDVNDEMEDLWFKYKTGEITNNQYSTEYNRLYTEYETYREKSVSNLNKVVRGSAITAAALLALHLWDHFDSKREFDKFFEKHKASFNFTLNEDNNIITAVRLNF